MRIPLSAVALLLLLAGLVRAGTLPSGRALEGVEPRKGAARAVDAGAHRVSGQDGPPAWHWPDLPGDDVAYRVKLECAPGLDLRGLLVGSAGSVDGVRNALRLRLLGALDEVLLDSSRVFPGGGGRLDTLRLDVTGAMLTGQDSLLVEFISSHPDSALWITADDDCTPGNRSWIRAPGTGNPDFQPLDRDLNIRLLFAAGATDSHAPALQAPRRLACHPSRAALPLRVRVRDESRVDTVWVEGPGLPATGLGLTRLGAAADPSWEEWSGGLPGSLVAEGPVELTVRARDAAGQETMAPLTLEPLETLAFSASSGRDDRSWQPGFPPAPGLVLGVPVDLGAAALAHGQSAVVVTGARLWPRGGEGGNVDTLIVRLVEAAAEGLPALDSSWVELAPARRVGWSGACPGPLDLAFELTDPGESQGSRAWILVDYSHASQAVLPTALLLEEWAPGETAAGVDVASCSWSRRPLEGIWQRIPAGRLRVEALLEPLGCDRGLPFVADFDATFPDLDCWQETHPGTSLGWQTSGAGGTTSTCYTPEDPRFDPDDQRSGAYAFINSDAQGQNAQQDDWLITPWLVYTDGAELSFASCMGYVEADVATVLARRRIGETPQEWETVLGMDEMLSLSDILLDPDCITEHPNWNRVTATLAPAGEAGEIQLGFHYVSAWGTGWALDSIRVDPAPPAAGPFDGPSVKTAELGRIHPNPFNPETVIPFRLRQSGPVRLEVYNVAGQRVATLLDEAHRRAGEYRAVFRPGALSSGVYLARLEAAGAVDTRRLVYLK